ncbi:MAG: DUF2075 domain-containing protein [Gammaproteobacteria bacterium]|nr:DUF2075 domain-containing protein [Gammaproteobacteria bacterium]
MIDAANVSVFFIDDQQVMRPKDLNPQSLFVTLPSAMAVSCTTTVWKAQFRCASSAGLLNWVNDTLDIERAANVVGSSILFGGCALPDVA